MGIATLFGLQGGPIQWEGFQVYPGTSEVGNDGIGRHSESWNADLTISLFDAWPIEPESFRESGMRWVPWFPVDMDPLPELVRDKVRHAYASIVFSRFGERVCREAGLTPHYIPHGVDLKTYVPMPKAEARRALGCPPDRFVVGMVAANKDFPSRKSIPQVIEAFARFASRHKDALLYLHTKSNDDPLSRAPVSIPHLVKHFGIQDRVITAEGYHLAMGYSDSYMVQLYSALDCLASPSLGEGFGVPILEAQACGCPVLVGDWTSMGELCFAGHKIPFDRSEPFWTGLNSFQRVPHVAAIEAGLEELYERRHDAQLRHRAREGAKQFDVEVITRDYWVPLLAKSGGPDKEWQRAKSEGTTATGPPTEGAARVGGGSWLHPQAQRDCQRWVQHSVLGQGLCRLGSTIRVVRPRSDVCRHRESCAAARRNDGGR